MKSRLAIKFLTLYEWWSNAFPPEQENASNARGMPVGRGGGGGGEEKGMLKLRFDWYIDHFHKWRPIIYSFASIKISLTDLILNWIIQKSFYSQTRLVRLI